jgi:hypothetical protein
LHGHGGASRRKAGAFWVATVHPRNRSAESLGDYFADHRVAVAIEHEGMRMTFEAIDRCYARPIAVWCLIAHLGE